MNVIEGLERVSPPIAESTVAIGTFDGIHVGHQAIIRSAVNDAREHGRPAIVFTFDRHPAELLAPERAPAYLTTPEQRNRLIEAMDVDALVIARFDVALSRMSPESFVHDILIEKLGAKAIVEGDNFMFGKDRAGNVEFLRRMQATFGYELISLEPVLVDGESAGSTRVRELLAKGRVDEAERVLGHPYLLAGVVVQGRRLGRKLGYPTANLSVLCRQAVPMDGVYAVNVTLDDGRTLGGACSIGDRPTIDGAGRSIETFLFDFDEQIYERRMEIRFLRRLRDERKFDTLQALTEQMARDVEQARELV